MVPACLDSCHLDTVLQLLITPIWVIKTVLMDSNCMGQREVKISPALTRLLAPRQSLLVLFEGGCFISMAKAHPKTTPSC